MCGLLAAGLERQPLDLQRVDVGAIDHQPQPVGIDLQRGAGALCAHAFDQRVERARRRYQCAPQPGGHLIGRDRLAGGQCEQRDQRPVALAGRGTEGAVDLDLHRSEQLDSHNRAA